SGALDHRKFRDLPQILRPDDLLVINETRVLRARLHGRREPTGGAVELLLLRPVDGRRFDPSIKRWWALAKPARRLTVGTRIRFGDEATARVVAAEAGGMRGLEFEIDGSFATFLERYGEVPLPPYVGPGDRDRDAAYQTVFARVPGSAAAPTASLHFTDHTFAQLAARGVEVGRIILDVGIGTFKPIATDRVAAHRMHAERYEIPPETAAAIAAAKRAGRRIVAAGTTVVRALEAAADGTGVRSGEAEADLFIRPGYRFAVVDALLTNFHLPGSTLLVLVSAFAGYERTIRAYRAAIDERYRFYSFGDAMLVARE
ncbi:MAG: tRNA preQ1(34) S-adenosylmethionine ribosyltransferase-isomerase QueA, partial [Vulcanimicrobiaceae bacterium]